MASNSSKALPYLVLLIVFFSLVVEVRYDVDVDLAQILPFLIAIGVTGGAIKAVKEASKIKKILPDDLKKTIQELLLESETRMAQLADDKAKKVWQRKNSQKGFIL